MLHIWGFNAKKKWGNPKFQKQQENLVGKKDVKLRQ